MRSLVILSLWPAMSALVAISLRSGSKLSWEVSSWSRAVSLRSCVVWQVVFIHLIPAAWRREVRPVVPEWAEDAGPHLIVVFAGWLMSYWGPPRERWSGDSIPVKLKSKIRCGVTCWLSDVRGFWLSQVGVVGRGGASAGDAPGCALT
jgi:hypothetical protein